MKDPRTKPKRARIEGGRWGLVRWGKVVVGKWRQLYSNINKETKLVPWNPILDQQVYFWGIQATDPSISPIFLEVIGKLTEFAWSSMRSL